MDKRLIWRWSLALSIIVILLLWKGYSNQREESRNLKDQLNYVKEQTCFDKFQTLDEIKEDHRLALENVEQLYMSKWKAQFQAKRGSGSQEVVTTIYKEILNQEEQLSWLEMRSWEVRQTIANCNQ